MGFVDGCQSITRSPTIICNILCSNLISYLFYAKTKSTCNPRPRCDNFLKGHRRICTQRKLSAKVILNVIFSAIYCNYNRL